MNWKEYQELQELNRDLKEKIDSLTKLFQGEPTPVGAGVKFTPEQNKAIENVSEVWEKYKRMARAFGARVN